jgi:hypothetical protein
MSRPVPSQQRLITSDEMKQSSFANAYEVVETLRPQWFRTRGRASLSQSVVVKVYLDGALLGGPDQMRHITTRALTSIRYLDGSEATLRWGLDHGQGAIVISTQTETASPSLRP